MAKRKISNLLALAVLSLLSERPMHPYEISAVMKQRELSTVIKLNQSSLYSIIETLVREELIMPVETQREGRYPERTVYTTTEAGKTELADWLRSLLRAPGAEYTPFAAALAFMGHLSPAEVTVLLEEYASHLQEEIQEANATLERASQWGVDRLFLIEDLYTRTMLKARHTFIQQILQEIQDGTLTQLTVGQRTWKIQRPNLSTLGSEEGIASDSSHQNSKEDR